MANNFSDFRHFEGLILVQNVDILQCPGLASRQPARFLTIRRHVFKTFLARLVWGSQNLLILTLGILEVLILVQNVDILQCPALGGRRPS